MTLAQRKALEWLPADGSYKGRPRGLVRALASLSLGYPGCIRFDFLTESYRLTPLGQKLREEVLKVDGK